MSSTTKRSSIVLLALLWSVSGCSVDPVDLSGKSCPCEGGWHCVDGECVAGQPDAGPGCGEPGNYELQSFAAGWRTQNALQWAWETAPDVEGDDLLHATVVIGTDEPEVERCACALARGERCDESADLRVVDDTDNPELAYDTRDNRTGGPEPVRSTVTSGLEPDTVYAATLLAFDTTGGVSRTPVAFNRTGREAERAVTVFDDGTTENGYPIPACFETGADGFTHYVQCPPPEGERGGCKIEADPCPEDSRWPGASSDAWLCEPDVHPDHESTCWVTLRWQELALPLDSITSGAFAEAFLEFEATLEGEPSNYGEAYLALQGPSGTKHWGLRGELALRGEGETHVYQVPLHALTSEDGTPMDWSDLQGRQIYRVSVGGFFTHGRAVSVHSFAIRY